MLLKPIRTVESGDTVVLDTLPAALKRIYLQMPLGLPLTIKRHWLKFHLVALQVCS